MGISGGWTELMFSLNREKSNDSLWCNVYFAYWHVTVKGWNDHGFHGTSWETRLQLKIANNNIDYNTLLIIIHDTILWDQPHSLFKVWYNYSRPERRREIHWGCILMPHLIAVQMRPPGNQKWEDDELIIHYSPHIRHKRNNKLQQWVQKTIQHSRFRLN